MAQNLSYGWVSHWFTAPWLSLQISFQKQNKQKKRQGREKDRAKEWHSWHYSAWFRETSSCLASANVITMMRWWGNPSVFPSVVCLIVRAWVCLNHTPEYEYCTVSPVSWRICRVYVWVLCLAWVVIVFQTCGTFTAEWVTPTSICCLPPQSRRGLIRAPVSGNWPDQTTAPGQEVCKRRTQTMWFHSQNLLPAAPPSCLLISFQMVAHKISLSVP